MKYFLVVMFLNLSGEPYLENGLHPLEKPIKSECVKAAGITYKNLVKVGIKRKYYVSCVKAVNSDHSVIVMKKLIKNNGMIKVDEKT